MSPGCPKSKDSPFGKEKSDKITYKLYEQSQIHLIPPSADELIPQDHLVRLVSQAIDEMGILRLLEQHRTGGGTSRYHPVMMAKLFVYGLHGQGMPKPDACEGPFPKLD
jgi:transposase